MNYWLVVGSKKNWDTAFQHRNIWGLRKTQRLLWESIDEKDKVLFYATQPVGGIIGYGIVRTKFIQDKPLWPDELKHKLALIIQRVRKMFNMADDIPDYKVYEALYVLHEDGLTPLKPFA